MFNVRPVQSLVFVHDNYINWQFSSSILRNNVIFQLSFTHIIKVYEPQHCIDCHDILVVLIQMIKMFVFSARYEFS